MPRLGVLVPSSNTVLEPLVSSILSGVPDVSAHFSRFPVTRIDLTPDGRKQFAVDTIVTAAQLLADAEVDVICWNGTSSGWLGFETDHALCAALQAETGIPAVTSVLALNEALACIGATTLGLVTPYTSDVQAMIIANYRGIGVTCVAEQHLGLSRNFDFASVAADTLDRGLRHVATGRPAAMTTFCTNLNAAALVHDLEAELAVPIFDTVATGIWKALLAIDGRPERVRGWGSLFSLSPPSGRA